MERLKTTWTKLALLLTAVAIPAGSIACGSAGDEPTATTSEALTVIRPPGGPTGTVIIGPGWAPIPVYPAKVLSGVSNDAVDTVSIGWNEPGGNGTTILYRQLYDLAGNPSGGQQELARWSGLGQHAMTFADRNQQLVEAVRTGARAIVPIGVIGIGASGAIQPDRQIGYEVVEIANGYSDCESLPGGDTCARTSTVVYTPKKTPYGIGRAQLRIKVASTTANVGSLHVLAQLNAWNDTWLDSTSTDFVTGSNVTYDLSTSSLAKLTDVEFVNLWTPDADGICVSEVELKLDNTTAFQQTFPTCQWVENGSTLNVPFAAIRSSAQWQAYKPNEFLANQSPRLTFVGLDQAGLISYLDTAVGTQLKNTIPTAADGDDAQLGSASSVSRTDSTHLHVQQHLRNLHVAWDGISFGDVDANPSYDLVIYQASDGKCDAGQSWCIHVENTDVGASYGSGFGEWMLGFFTSGFSDLIEHFVNDKLESALNGTKSGLTNPQDYAYCFAPAPGAADPKVPLFGNWWDNGASQPWTEGSLVICR